MSVELTLYYANWCGYCVSFKPEWTKLENYISRAENSYNGINIKVAEYEHEQLEKIGGGKINEKDIQGYPTVKIKLSKGKDSKEYDFGDYGKERNADYMVFFIKNVCNGLSKYKN